MKEETLPARRVRVNSNSLRKELMNTKVCRRLNANSKKFGCSACLQEQRTMVEEVYGARVLRLRSSPESCRVLVPKEGGGVGGIAGLDIALVLR